MRWDRMIEVGSGWRLKDLGRPGCPYSTGKPGFERMRRLDHMTVVGSALGSHHSSRSDLEGWRHHRHRTGHLVDRVGSHQSVGGRTSLDGEGRRILVDRSRQTAVDRNHLVDRTVVVVGRSWGRCSCYHRTGVAGGSPGLVGRIPGCKTSCCCSGSRTFWR